MRGGAGRDRVWRTYGNVMTAKGERSLVLAYTHTVITGCLERTR